MEILTKDEYIKILNEEENQLYEERDKIITDYTQREDKINERIDDIQAIKILIENRKNKNN